MKILTVRQPWAWLIVAGHKDIENRTWVTSYRGPLLIQASARRSPDHSSACAFARERGVIVPELLDFGGIIGIVTLVDCVQQNPSHWFHGPVGWILRDPHQLPFVPVRGQLGLFDASTDVLAKISPTLKGFQHRAKT